MRQLKQLLWMWNHCSDGELLDWAWEYERILRGDPDNEHLWQDLSAINQLLKSRNL